jgi:ubiquitin
MGMTTESWEMVPNPTNDEDERVACPYCGKAHEWEGWPEEPCADCMDKWLEEGKYAPSESHCEAAGTADEKPDGQTENKEL